MNSIRWCSRLALCLLCLVPIAVPASAAQIQNGTDVWHTPGDGTTFADFTREPIPAGFFCPGSSPFAGRIVFQGVPLATAPPGVLGKTDTLLQRLDDAAFDRDGVAVTRLQMLAMQFEGVEPLRNECGAFAVSVVLNGAQPVTEMRIHRVGEGDGFGDHGFFESVVGVNVRILFTPSDHKGLAVHLDRNLLFPPSRNTWAASPGEKTPARPGFVLVDTDADGVADTNVPAASEGFAAGWLDRGDGIVPFDPGTHGLGPIGYSGGYEAPAPIPNCETCHCSDDCGIHCPQTVPSY